MQELTLSLCRGPPHPGTPPPGDPSISHHRCPTRCRPSQMLRACPGKPPRPPISLCRPQHPAPPNLHRAWPAPDGVSDPRRLGNYFSELLQGQGGVQLGGEGQCQCGSFMGCYWDYPSKYTQNAKSVLAKLALTGSKSSVVFCLLLAGKML